MIRFRLLDALFTSVLPRFSVRTRLGTEAGWPIIPRLLFTRLCSRPGFRFRRHFGPRRLLLRLGFQLDAGSGGQTLHVPVRQPHPLLNKFKVRSIPLDVLYRQHRTEIVCLSVLKSVFSSDKHDVVIKKEPAGM